MKIKLILLPMLVVLASCGRFSNNDNAQNQGPKAVCIAKQYTEIIFALGAGDRLAAVDVSSTYPEEAKKLPTVGYHRALSIEGLLAVEPKLIIHDNNIGPEHVAKQIEKLGIPVKTFGHYSSTINGTDSLIHEIGAYFHKEKAADSLSGQLRSDMNAVLKLSHDSAKPRVCIIHYGQASNVYLTMTKKSTAAKMIQWAGGEMSLDGEKGMMPLSAEVVAQADPDVIFVTDFGYDRLGDPSKINDLPGVAETKAAKSGRVFRIEEHDLVYLGPRTGKNVLMLHELMNRIGDSEKK